MTTNANALHAKFNLLLNGCGYVESGRIFVSTRRSLKKRKNARYHEMRTSSALLTLYKLADAIKGTNRIGSATWG